MQIHTIHQSITCFLIQSEYVREMILVNKVGWKSSVWPTFSAKEFPLNVWQKLFL